MQGPVGLTISVDGRVLVLERLNARIQASHPGQPGPVFCWCPLLHAPEQPRHGAQPVVGLHCIGAGVAEVRASDGYSPRSLQPSLSPDPVFSLPASYVAVLNAGTVTADLDNQFEKHALTLGKETAVLQTAEGIWLLQDVANGANHDIHFNGRAQRGGRLPLLHADGPGQGAL